MPAYLEKKLAEEYGKKSPAIYATMNKLGLMKGSKETAKGRAAREHDSKRKTNIGEMMGK